MGEQNNLGVVRMAYDAFGRGDINALLNLFAENIDLTTSGPSDLPTAGSRRGRQAVGEFFRILNETFEILDFQPKRVHHPGRSRHCHRLRHRAPQDDGKNAAVQLGAFVYRQGRHDRPVHRIRRHEPGCDGTANGGSTSPMCPNF